MRDPDHEEPEVPGGRAAERLRQFLAATYGDEAPSVPPNDEIDDDGLFDEIDDERRPTDDDAAGNGEASQDSARPIADSDS